MVLAKECFGLNSSGILTSLPQDLLSLGGLFIINFQLMTTLEKGVAALSQSVVFVCKVLNHLITSSLPALLHTFFGNG
jgi:hypothetical protein